MILRIEDGVTRLAFDITHWPTQRRVSDWRNLQLLITPGEEDGQCCHVGGSPWYLYGCWPGKWTGVDVANPPRPDFPAFCIDAFERDDRGRIVFILPERWRDVAHGRYTGAIRYMPHARQPFNLGLSFHHKTPDYALPPELLAQGCADRPSPEPVYAPPEPPCCVLARFLIDVGARCSEHIVETATFEFALSDCGLE